MNSKELIAERAKEVIKALAVALADEILYSKTPATATLELLKDVKEEFDFDIDSINDAIELKAVE